MGEDVEFAGEALTVSLDFSNQSSRPSTMLSGAVFDIDGTFGNDAVHATAVAHFVVTR